MSDIIKSFTGLPVSSGTYEGTVKVLIDTKEFDKVEEGDVIVVYASSPAWTVPLLKSGALIAEVGGILCHTGIIAREIGVPAVVNIENITKLLKDGDRVIVNGEAGEINVLN
jgi:pyruvate,water dikinase